MEIKFQSLIILKKDNLPKKMTIIIRFFFKIHNCGYCLDPHGSRALWKVRRIFRLSGDCKLSPWPFILRNLFTYIFCSPDMWIYYFILCFISISKVVADPWVTVRESRGYLLLFERTWKTIDVSLNERFFSQNFEKSIFLLKDRCYWTSRFTEQCFSDKKNEIDWKWTNKTEQTTEMGLFTNDELTKYKKLKYLNNPFEY